jgi:hypothetical protein
MTMYYRERRSPGNAGLLTGSRLSFLHLHHGVSTVDWKGREQTNVFAARESGRSQLVFSLVSGTRASPFAVLCQAVGLMGSDAEPGGDRTERVYLIGGVVCMFDLQAF